MGDVDLDLLLEAVRQDTVAEITATFGELAVMYEVEIDVNDAGAEAFLDELLDVADKQHEFLGADTDQLVFDVIALASARVFLAQIQMGFMAQIHDSAAGTPGLGIQ